MKKFVSLFTTLCIVFGVLGTFTVFAKNTSETMEISTLADLEKFRDKVNSGEISYMTGILATDIDMSEKYGEGKEKWISIGTEEHPFSGYFIGDGHTINLSIVSETGGLFGYTDNGTIIRNLAVSGSVTVIGTIYLTPPSSSKLMHIGAIVGYNDGSIDDCSSTADVTFTGNYGNVGGIAGTSTAGSMKGCYSTGNIIFMDSPQGSNITNTERPDLIHNCFYLSDEEEQNETGAYGKTAEQFASGEVAYLLNNSTSDEKLVSWYQNIGSDAFPVLDNTHSVVYMKYYNNTPVPSNKINADIGTYMLGDNSYNVPHIFKTYNELKEYAGENSRLLEIYPQSFFEDKFLYARFIDGGSGSNKYVINTAEEGNSINIEITKTQEGMTDDYVEYCLYAEIDKSLESKDINVICKNMISESNITYHIGRVQTQKDFLPEDSLKLDYAIVNSKEELASVWKGEGNVNNTYGTEFFYNRSLLIVSWTQQKTKCNYKAENIILSDKGIDVTLSYFLPEGARASEKNDYSAVISIPKSYADKKAAITIDNSKSKTYPYQITGLRFTNTAGEEIIKPSENQSFIVEADIVKQEERNEKDYLFVAVYDEDGALLSLDYVKAKFTVDGECSFGFNIPAQKKAVGSVKAFVWNTFNLMEPLAVTNILAPVVFE